MTFGYPSVLWFIYKSLSAGNYQFMVLLDLFDLGVPKIIVTWTYKCQKKLIKMLIQKTILTSDR